MKASGQTTPCTGPIPRAFLTRTSADGSGRVASDRCVYGVPEMLVISKGRRVARNHIGSLMPAALEKCRFSRSSRGNTGNDDRTQVNQQVDW